MFYHVGNGKELRSIVHNGLVPVGFSTKTGRHAVFFTVVNPMDDEQGLREIFCDLSKARIAPSKILGKQIRIRYTGAIHCSLKKEDCDFTKRVPMRSSSMTHCLQSSLRKRYAWKLKNSFTKEKAQDHVLFSVQIRNVDYKIYPGKKQDHLGKHNIVDYSVPDFSLSTVLQQDEQRQHTVAKLIEKFESHQHKEQFLRDTSQTQKINRFSEASQKMLQDMDLTEIFEVRILPHFNAPIATLPRKTTRFIAVVDEILKTSRSPTTFHYDFNSIPSCIIKKNSSRRPKHGQSERQLMFFKAKDMLRKAKKKNHPTILSSWKAQRSYRSSLEEHGFGEKEIMLYDQIALERYDYTATKAERKQNSKHWVISINPERPQLPRQQRPDYAAAKWECQRLQDVYMRQNPNRQFEGSEDYDYVVDRKTGWTWYQKEQQGNLPLSSSSSSSSLQNS